jgi:hypothetical protein
MTAKQILEKYRSAFLYIDEHVIDGEIGSVYDAMKEIAEHSFHAGMKYLSYLQNPKGHEPDKEQFIKQLFGEEDI